MMIPSKIKSFISLFFILPSDGFLFDEECSSNRKRRDNILLTAFISRFICVCVCVCNNNHEFLTERTQNDTSQQYISEFRVEELES